MTAEPAVVETVDIDPFESSNDDFDFAVEPDGVEVVFDDFDLPQPAPVEEPVEAEEEPVTAQVPTSSELEQLKAEIAALRQEAETEKGRRSDTQRDWQEMRQKLRQQEAETRSLELAKEDRQFREDFLKGIDPENLNDGAAILRVAGDLADKLFQRYASRTTSATSDHLEELKRENESLRMQMIESFEVSNLGIALNKIPEQDQQDIVNAVQVLNTEYAKRNQGRSVFSQWSARDVMAAARQYVNQTKPPAPSTPEPQQEPQGSPQTARPQAVTPFPAPAKPDPSQTVVRHPIAASPGAALTDGLQMAPLFRPSINADVDEIVDASLEQFGL